MNRNKTIKHNAQFIAFTLILALLISGYPVIALIALGFFIIGGIVGIYAAKVDTQSRLITISTDIQNKREFMNEWLKELRSRQ